MDEDSFALPTPDRAYSFGADWPMFPDYERFLAENDIDVAGIEMIGEDGVAWTYDV